MCTCRPGLRRRLSSPLIYIYGPRAEWKRDNGVKRRLSRVTSPNSPPVWSPAMIPNQTFRSRCHILALKPKASQRRRSVLLESTEFVNESFRGNESRNNRGNCHTATLRFPRSRGHLGVTRGCTVSVGGPTFSPDQQPMHLVSVPSLNVCFI